jgi:trimeric autotransporter adhesin
LNNVSVLLDDGSGGFASSGDLPVGSIPNSTLGITSTDFNRDGKADLAATTDSSKVAVLLGNGSGGFGTATKFTAGGDPQNLISADFNRDGRPGDV